MLPAGLFDAGDDATLPDGVGELFEFLPGGRVLDVRLDGDDTPDWLGPNPPVAATARRSAPAS